MLVEESGSGLVLGLNPGITVVGAGVVWPATEGVCPGAGAAAGPTPGDGNATRPGRMFPGAGTVPGTVAGTVPGAGAGDTPGRDPAAGAAGSVVGDGTAAFAPGAGNAAAGVVPAGAGRDRGNALGTAVRFVRVGRVAPGTGTTALAAGGGGIAPGVTGFAVASAAGLASAPAVPASVCAVRRHTTWSAMAIERYRRVFIYLRRVLLVLDALAAFVEAPIGNRAGAVVALAGGITFAEGVLVGAAGLAAGRGVLR